jgi:hypothetical protein
MRGLAASGRSAFFAAGLLLSAVMLLRAQPGGDQLNLLARGWLWAAEGELVPFGNPLSSGGNGPGALTTILAGGPLFVWMDHRAPAFLVWAAHLAAYLLLARALAPHLAPVEQAAFLAVYWLNPWRLEASAYLWNPNYLFLAGAAHLATALASRERASFAHSALHAATIGLALQLHPGALLLAALSALLWWRGWLRLHWGGVAAGVLAAALPLLPWALEARERPGILGASEGFPFRGLVLLFPLLKGMLYLVRYASLSLNTQTTRFDFSEVLGPVGDAIAAPAARILLWAAGSFTAAAALVALWRFFRGRRPLERAPEGGIDGRRWLEAYAALAFVAAVAVFAAIPTTPQGWQALALFHAAVLPVVFAAGAFAAREGGEPRVRRAVAGFAALALALDLALAFGGQNFRCGGRHPLIFPLRSHSPMFDELGIQRSCPWPLDQPGGWWPDVLPEATGAPASERR